MKIVCRVDHMLLVKGLLTLSMCVGLNNSLILTPYEVRWVGLIPRFLTMYDNCIHISLMSLEIDLLTQSMHVELYNPLILTQYEVRWVGHVCPWVSKKV